MATDQKWLRERLEELERIDRPSASEGERRAAEWLVASYAELGVEARIEAETAHGTYWWPLGIGAALGALGGHRRRCVAAACSGRCSARSAPPASPTTSRPASGACAVSCPSAPPTTSSASSATPRPSARSSSSPTTTPPTPGLVFHPQIPLIADRLGLIEKQRHQPAADGAGPRRPAAGRARRPTGKRLLAKLGLFLGLGSVAAMADIGLRKVVPGANDNGTAVVAELALAKSFVEEPPEGIRVILLSVGSEESFSEGMKAFGERHFPGLPRESTFFLCLESIGSPHLLALRAEGFLKLHDYPPRSLALIDGLAEEMGIWLYPNLRLHNGTDGLEPLAAGYETVALCGCTDLKQPANYHWWHDLAENVNFNTVEDGIKLSEAAIRRLGERWL